MKPFYSVIKSRQQKALLYAYWNSSLRTYFFFVFPSIILLQRLKKITNFLSDEEFTITPWGRNVLFTSLWSVYYIFWCKRGKYWWFWSSLYSTLPILLLGHILYSKTSDVQTQSQERSYSVLNGRKELHSVCDNSNFTLYCDSFERGLKSFLYYVNNWTVSLGCAAVNIKVTSVT